MAALGRWPRADRIQLLGFTETKVRPPLECLKLTVPVALANRVWSLPMPTLAPGWNLVPRWRTRMLPARTSSAPNFLTPRRRPAVSRPLRDEPPAFLCAIAQTPYAARLGGLDVGDAQHRLELPVAALAAIVVAAMLLEDQHLVGLGLVEHLGHDRSALHQRRADLQVGIFAHHQDFAERHIGAGFDFQLLDQNDVVLGDLVLLAARLDHCEHVVPSRSFPTGRKRHSGQKTGAACPDFRGGPSKAREYTVGRRTVNWIPARARGCGTPPVAAQDIEIIELSLDRERHVEVQGLGHGHGDGALGLQADDGKGAGGGIHDRGKP